MKTTNRTSPRTLAICLVAAVAVVWPTPASAQSEDPESRRVDLGGFWLNLRCAGVGSPTVVLDGGAGAWSLHYRHIQDALARTTRVCAYDRAGLGASDPSPAPRTSENMAIELHDLLDAAHESAPYVLVGHSLGGYNVRLFADRYPDLVAGIVLTESGHEAQFERLPPEVAAAIGQAAPQFRALAEMARKGQLPEQPVPDLPAFAAHPELRSGYAEAVQQASLYEAWASEMEWAAESAAQVARTGSLGDLPLVVVTAGNSFAPYGALGIPVDAANEVWMQLQSEFLDLSTDAVQLVAPDATHQIGSDAPELVVTAIERVIRAVRRGARVASTPDPGGEGSHLFQLWHEYLDTINARSLDRLMEFFSPDAVLMPPNQPTVHGVAGARAWFGALFDAFEVQLEMPTLELHVLGDWALRRGTYEVSLTPVGGGATNTDRGKFMQVWERQGDGVWRIARGLLNSDLPLISGDRSGSVPPSRPYSSTFLRSIADPRTAPGCCDTETATRLHVGAQRVLHVMGTES